MEHLKIAFYLAAQLIGAGAVAYAVLMSRTYRLPFLGAYAWFLGFNNILALANLTSAYACANLLGFCVLFQYSVYGRVLGPVARLSQVGMVYALLAIVRGFRGRRLSHSFKTGFGIATGILLAGYVVWAVLPQGNDLRQWIARGERVVSLLGVLVIPAALAGLILGSRKIHDAAERNAVRAFGIAYFVVYSVFVITMPLPISLQFPPNALALLAINIIPFLWFGKTFTRAYTAAPASAEDREAFERFCRTHGLTAREADILDLILRGKSNADMEKDLFISIHTVKNHITSIHSKLGVRSRWQLISLFHQGRLGRPSAGPVMAGAGSRPQSGLRVD